MKALDWTLARLSENSTWRGLIGITTGLGVTLKPELSDAIVAAGLAAIGLVNVLRKAG